MPTAAAELTSAELIEGALWTRRNHWRALEAAYRELLVEAGD